MVSKLCSPMIRTVERVGFVARRCVEDTPTRDTASRLCAKVTPWYVSRKGMPIDGVCSAISLFAFLLVTAP